MELRQRNKIYWSIETLLNGYSKENEFMTKASAYDILADYVSIYDAKRKGNKNTKDIKIELNETEDTETLIRICRLFLNNAEVKKSVKAAKKIIREQENEERLLENDKFKDKIIKLKIEEGLDS